MTSKTLRVLQVEDSADDALLIQDMLEAAGYQVLSVRVETAEAMSDALAGGEWDVIISDYRLPRFSAPAALEVARASGRDLPFLVVSGAVGEDAAVALMKAGAHDYLMKDRLTRLVPAVEREVREAEVRRQRYQAEQARLRLASIIEATTDCVSLIGPTGECLYLNPSGRALLGIGSNDDITSFNMLDFLTPWARERIREESVPTALRDGVWSGETAVVTPGGTEVPLSQVLLASIGPDGSAESFSAIARDISERKQAEEALTRLALYDSLTGLPNRVLLHDRLQQAIATARRQQHGIALYLIDLDRFKDVNDTYGHRAGDVLLQAVSERLRTALRPMDTVARLGGDEFAVLATGPSTAEEASELARRLLQAIAPVVEIEGHAVDATASVGIALYPQHGHDSETLLRCADVAMYVAKRGGTGHATYAPEQDPYAPGRLLLASELRQGIEHDELVLHYQPKISSATGRMIGVEALVRWQHPRHGLVYPDQFIPLAEQTGAIQPLSRWVLREALRQFRDWYDQGLVIPVAINLSMANLHDPEMLGTIVSLKDHFVAQAPPHMLCAEITESATMVHPARTIEMLTQLRGLGVHLAIDDFGTGYSSLVYLKRLPVHHIKIDKSFVRDMLKNENDAVIVRSTIDLGHNLGLSIVAEGVEDQATWQRLRELGCDQGQGYHFSRPLSVSALHEWLAKHPEYHPGQLIAAHALASSSSC